MRMTVALFLLSRTAYSVHPKPHDRSSSELFPLVFKAVAVHRIRFISFSFFFFQARPRLKNGGAAPRLISLLKLCRFDRRCDSLLLARLLLLLSWFFRCCRYFCSSFSLSFRGRCAEVDRRRTDTTAVTAVNPGFIIYRFVWSQPSMWATVALQAFGPPREFAVTRRDRYWWKRRASPTASWWTALISRTRVDIGSLVDRVRRPRTSAAAIIPVW